MSDTDQTTFDVAYNEAMTNMYQGRPVGNVSVWGDNQNVHIVITFADEAEPPTLELVFDYDVAPGL